MAKRYFTLAVAVVVTCLVSVVAVAQAAPDGAPCNCIVVNVNEGGSFGSSAVGAGLTAWNNAMEGGVPTTTSSLGGGIDGGGGDSGGSAFGPDYGNGVLMSNDGSSVAVRTSQSCGGGWCSSVGYVGDSKAMQNFAMQHNIDQVMPLILMTSPIRIVRDAEWVRLLGEIEAVKNMTGRQLGSVPFYHNTTFGEQMGKHFVYDEGGLLELGEKGVAGLQGRARAALAEWRLGRRSIQEIIRDSSRLSNYFIKLGEKQGLENGGTRYWNGVHPDMSYDQGWYNENGFTFKKFPAGPGSIPSWARPFE
jgi:hypothetical protein